MSYHKHRSHASSAKLLRARSTRHDALVGIAAVGGLLVVLAWVVTGVDLFAIIALLIAFGSFVVASMMETPGEATAFESAHRELGKQLATEHRIGGRFKHDDEGDLDREILSTVLAAKKHSASNSSTNGRGRSGYDGLAS